MKASPEPGNRGYWGVESAKPGDSQSTGGLMECRQSQPRSKISLSDCPRKITEPFPCLRVAAGFWPWERGRLGGTVDWPKARGHPYSLWDGHSNVLLVTSERNSPLPPGKAKPFRTAGGEAAGPAGCEIDHQRHHKCRNSSPRFAGSRRAGQVPKCLLRKQEITVL